MTFLDRLGSVGSYGGLAMTTSVVVLDSVYNSLRRPYILGIRKGGLQYRIDLGELRAVQQV